MNNKKSTNKNSNDKYDMIYYLLTSNEDKPNTKRDSKSHNDRNYEHSHSKKENKQYWN